MDEPPKRRNTNRREVAIIFCTKAKFSEEMLSQKTTVERPLAANTSKI